MKGPIDKKGAERLKQKQSNKTKAKTIEREVETEVDTEEEREEKLEVNSKKCRLVLGDWPEGFEY